MDGARDPIELAEGRFARLEAIEWWDQARLRDARILVVGAGALGNEVLKNLALLGAGHVIVVDMDRVELSNLSRSVLFREDDEGRPKAECAARAMTALCPEVDAVAIHGNVSADVGLGHFRWAQVVVGALDNREARLFVNGACARLGRPWIDGGIDVLQGIVRGFQPPETACYECTMSIRDWEAVNLRRSCSLLARRALDAGGTPTTPTTASVVGAMQVQEVVKVLHGMDALLGSGVYYDGLGHDSYRVGYPINPECPQHDAVPPVESVAHFSQGTRLGDIWDHAARRLGGVDALLLAREMVASLSCSTCGGTANVMRAADALDDDAVRCPVCGEERAPRFVHALREGDEWLDLSVALAGIPPWDILWAQRGVEALGIELGGDAPFPREG